MSIMDINMKNITNEVLDMFKYSCIGNYYIQDIYIEKIIIIKQNSTEKNIVVYANKTENSDYGVDWEKTSIIITKTDTVNSLKKKLSDIFECLLDLIILNNEEDEGPILSHIKTFENVIQLKFKVKIINDLIP